MPTPVGTSAQGSATNASSLTFSHDSGATGARRATAVFVQAYDTGAQVLTGVTYAGDAATQGASQGTINTVGVVRIYAREAPATGANNVVVSGNGLIDELYAQAQTFENVDQATRFGTQAGANGSGTTATPGTLTLSGSDIGLACVFAYSSIGYTITESDTLVAETQADSGRSAQYGDATLTWTFNNSVDWLAVAVPLIHDDGVAPEVDQEGFRFGLDDANEAGHTWSQAQDTNDTTALDLTRLVRFILNGTGDPASFAPTLYYQKNGAGGYLPVPVGSSSAVSPPGSPTGTGTTVGTAAGAWPITRPTAAAGDLVVFVIGWDDSTTVATVAAPAGPNGETAVSIAGPVASASTEVRAQAWYYISTGTWSGGTSNWTPAASETCRAVTFVIPSGQYNPSDPIGWADTRASAGTAESNVNSPTGTTEGDDENGRIYTAFCSDADALTVPGSNWNTINNATGGGVGLLVGSRATLAGNSESVTAQTATIASDSWCSLSFVVKPATVTNEIYVVPSANITAGGEDTTARLAAPSGKSTSDFVTGRRWDNENGADSLDITADDYTEVAWALALQAPAANGDYFDLRVQNAGTPLDTYGQTPRWTVGGSITGTLDQNLGTLTTTATGQLLIAARLDGTLGALTLETAGGPRIAASLDATLGTLTLEATMEGEAETVTATLDQALGALTLEAAAGVRITGTLDQYLGALTATATGQGLISGTLDQALGPLTSDARAQALIAAALDTELGALTLEARAGQALTAQLDATLGPLGLTAVAGLQITGTLDQTLGELTSEASATVAVTAQVDATLGALTLEATGQLRIVGTLDAALGALTLEAIGQVVGEGAYLDQALGALTLEGSATVRITGSLDASLGALTTEARAAVTLTAQLDQELGALTLEAATAPGPRELTLDQELGALTLTATGSTGGAVIEPEPPAATGGGVLPVRYRTRAPRRPLTYLDPLNIAIRATEEADVVVMSLEVVSIAQGRATEPRDRARGTLDLVTPLAVRAREDGDWVRSRMSADWAQDDADVADILRQLVA